ncbi:ATP synthase F0 subunit B [Candidatus Roizmanbacteria bacterium RIFCSPLOWO2_02_FULL_38_10]|uniref:ATP synthase subunit b n=1 Tax=Candidatus Roizmanbacteria bacterium RIFCSPLOWO2_02_FULL_38_10 TaxID=1802074 RepID=A0A1F7JNU7_9BACT|nr:MAG: ATP synthase F0 subunit B [Candidatus Roizmanbacteria bacterium RIFCSPLOWO2_02_FULL_38_10]
MEALGIDIKLIIAQVVNFFLFLILFKKFMAKPFYNYLDKLQRNNEDKEKILIEVQKMEEKAKKERAELVKIAREESNKIISDAKKTAVYQHEEIIKKAQEEASDIKKKAEKKLDEDKKTLYLEVREKLIDTSTLIVKQALHGYLDETKQKELMKKLLQADRVYEN